MAIENGELCHLAQVKNLDKYIEEMRLSPGIACNLDFMLGTACHMKSYIFRYSFITNIYELISKLHVYPKT